MKKNNKTIEDPFEIDMREFFYSDGTFNESKFRSSIRKSLISFKKDKKKNTDFSESAGEWLSSLLNKVKSYLKEKEQQEISDRFFKATVEEAFKQGVEKIKISLDEFKDFLVEKTSFPKSKDNNEIMGASDEKREKIFNAAIKVFYEYGFYKATIDDIVKASGIGKGSVYRYFENKEDLLEQILTSQYEKILFSVNQILLENNDPLIQIEKMIRYWIQFIQDNRIIYIVIQRESIYKSNGERVIFYDYFISLLPMLKDRIKEVYKKKKIKITDFYTVFYGILGFIDGVVKKWLRQDMSYPLTDEIPIILEVLYNGFVGEKLSRKRYFPE